MRDLFDTSEQDIKNLIERGALFVVNHSGGKDSQAMMLKIESIVPTNQILVVHAELPEVEWEGTIEHVKRYTQQYPLVIARAVKTLFEMVEHRGMFPSPQQRQCTSDLKRGPIEREIRKYLNMNPQYNGLIVNCMGLRAEESSNRAKATIFKHNHRNSKAGREWYDWLPIHDMLETEVFEAISRANQKPHWAYEAGMSRLSCCFCIMSNRQDLITAAKLNPNLYKRYVDAEKRLNHTLSMPIAGKQMFLEDITGIAA